MIGITMTTILEMMMITFIYNGDDDDNIDNNDNDKHDVQVF